MQASGAWVLDADDVDGDGRVDLVVANAGQNRAAILAGDGAGGFAPARLVGTGARPRALQLADMDGDGDLNIVTASDGTIRNLWVLTNRGSGDFAGIAHVSIGGKARSLRIADADGDGRADIAASDLTRGRVTVVPGRVPSGEVLTAADFAQGSEDWTATGDTTAFTHVPTGGQPRRLHPGSDCGDTALISPTSASGASSGAGRTGVLWTT